MQREDVIQLAREASEQHHAYSFPFLECFAAAVEQRTLERAAQTCYEMANHESGSDFSWAVRSCAAAIRALKDGT